jgi:ATP synthase protein I
MNGNGARDVRDGTSGATPGGDLPGRLERLGAELEKRRPASSDSPASVASSSDPTALGRALRASTEFIAGIIAGGAVGWAIDKGLGTSPWGLIVFLMLGFAAGVLNVLRTAGQPSSPAGGGSPGSRKP